MEELLEQPVRNAPLNPTRRVEVEVDERAARESLREQIAKLERDLAAAFVSAYPRDGFHFSVRSRGGPRLLALGELERVRDELADSLGQARRDLAARAEIESQNRLLIEKMLLEPGRYRWIRVSRSDIGEQGCGHWHVRPRLGLIGMLMGWWQVKVSSGCPLARGCGAMPQPA